ncbi:unnamed protein product [Penicillium salamii]|nr:unnamed protein product [Penicillium salamii]
MEPNIEQAIEQFKSLSHLPSRRKALDGILESLATNELRGVRDRILAVTFQRDIFGQLPVELICLVASHLDVKDIFNLRRVSRLWKEVLSVPVLLTTVLKNKLGKWPAPNSSIAGLESSLKTRWRMENGRPAALAYLTAENGDGSSQSAYCKGMLVFAKVDVGVVPRSDYDIMVLDVRTGAEKSIYIGNIEELLGIEISDRLIAASAVTEQGSSICYIWNIETGERKSFPLDFYVHGDPLVNDNSVIMYDDESGEVVHFCFISGMIRTIHLEHPVLNLSLHANGDFSTIEISMDIEQFEHDIPIRYPAWIREEHPLQARRFSPDGDGFRSSSARPFTMQSFLPSWGGDIQVKRLKMIKSGQSCCDILFKKDILYQEDGFAEDDYHRKSSILRFTRDDDDTIAAYWTPEKDSHMDGPNSNLVNDFIADQNIMYSRCGDRLTLAYGRFDVSSPLPGIAFYRFDNYQTLDRGSYPRIPYFHHEEKFVKWRGDDEFFVLELTGPDHGPIYVGSFNEDWKPAGLLADIDLLEWDSD